MRRLLVLLPVLLAAGCGGDDTEGMTDPQQVRAVAERYFEAMADGDAGGWCDTLSAAEDDRVVEGSGYDSCEEGVQDTVEMVGEQQLEAIRQIRVEEPRVTGDSATVEFSAGGRPGPQPLELTREDGEWKISRGFDG